MSHIARRIAELTSLRDRAQLQRRMIDLLVEHYQPQRARLMRLEPEGWISTWSSDALASIDNEEHARVAWHEALGRGQTVHLEREPALSVFPLGSSEVLELLLAEPPDEARHLVAEDMLRVLRNVLSLLDYGERDSLTGLLNRKTFDEVFMRLAGIQGHESLPGVQHSGRRHWRIGEPCWLAVMDIDHFKRVNDEFGHLVGDEVLLLVARLMAETFRQNDRLYRFGGEEFVVLMSCADQSGAWTALERMRTRIERHRFPRLDHLTISAGFTRVEGDDTPEVAFDRADKAVYSAKQTGRNRVVMYEPPALDVQASAAVSGVDFF